jgi:hypothetical protein
MSPSPLSPTSLHSRTSLEVEDYGLKESVRKVSPKIRAEPFLTPPWFFDKRIVAGAVKR